MSGIIAIVGRPNVGKSALFNRIAGKRIAIVHDLPGVTRDRVTAEVEWHGRPYTLVDTGGIGLLRREKSNDIIVKAAVAQVEMAIEAADAIIFVVNSQEGVVPLDREVADRLRLCGKPVLVAANKVDTAVAEKDTPVFSTFGFTRVFPVSAIHGLGIYDLMSAAMEYLPKFDPTPAPAPVMDESGSLVAEPVAEPVPEPATEAEAIAAPPLKKPVGPLKIAIVGRPNVGKSSIVNALTNSERVIVSPIAGTTRDSIDVPFEVETEGVRQRYILIDTAGMRKARRVDDTVEFFSVQRAEESIARSDITVLVIDAEVGITEQDKKIADVIVEQRRACIVVINKWDKFAESVKQAREEEIARRERKQRTEGQPKELTTLGEFGAWVQDKLFFLDYAPTIFTSATTGFHLDRLLEAVRYVAAQLQQKIPTSILNRTLHDAVEFRQPVSSAGHRLKFYYATQVRLAPPTFLLFVNRDDLLTDQYRKYLGDQMRVAFGYEGCPIVLVPKSRPKTVESKRKFRPLPAPGSDRGRSHESERHMGKPAGKPAGRGGGKPRPGARPSGRPTRASARPTARPGFGGKPGAPEGGFRGRPTGGKPGAPTSGFAGRPGKPKRNQSKHPARSGKARARNRGFK